MSTTTLRRLRPSVHIAPVPDGLLFIGWQQTLVVHGSESLTRLWDALFPHLHTGVEIDRLISALPEAARPVAQQVVDQLDENGFFLRERDLPEERTDIHPEHVRTRAFLDGAASDPAAAHERLRTSAVVVRGRGVVATHAARSLLRLGAGDVTVLDSMARQELTELAAEHRAHLRSEAPRSVAFTITVDEIFTPTEGASTGVHQLGDHALIGPTQMHLGEPGVDMALERLRERGDDTPCAPLGAVAGRLAGGLAALQVVHHLCGISTEYDGMTHLVDAERLATSTHPVGIRGDSSAAPVDTVGAEEQPAVEKEALEELTDSRTGVLPQLLPFALPQAPLALIQPEGRPEVVGWGASGAVARYRAALEAARLMAETDVARVWTESREEFPLPSLLTTAAGGDTDGMLGHGLQRLLAQILAEPVERSKRLVSGETTRLALTDVPRPVRDALLRLAVHNDVELTTTTSRPARGPAPLAVVEVMDAATGVVLAVAADRDEAHAQSVAIDHVTAVFGAAAKPEPIAQLALPPWADDGEVSLELDDVYKHLDQLCLPDETLVMSRWTSEPTLARLGVVGWVGIASRHLDLREDDS